MQTLSQVGIRPRSAGQSWKQTCPRCSETRKAKRDPCLSVTSGPNTTARGHIPFGVSVWNCHNCGWSGIADERAPEEQQRQPVSERLRVSRNPWLGSGPVRKAGPRKRTRSKWV